jgi:mono/diheme cytochrome c family protein
MTETTKSPYDLGWGDGYAEGYAAKMVDVGKPFMPAGTAAEIEAMADYLMNKHVGQFTRPDAIGVARGMAAAARSVTDAGTN